MAGRDVLEITRDRLDRVERALAAGELDRAVEILGEARHVAGCIVGDELDVYGYGANLCKETCARHSAAVSFVT